MVSMLDNFTDAQLQSSQVSSTVLDSPTMYPNWSYDQSSHLYSSPNQYANMHVQTPQYGGPQYPTNQAWMDHPQAKRQNMFYNSWEGWNSGYKEIKEDPDSTTMNSMNSDHDQTMMGPTVPVQDVKPNPVKVQGGMDSFLNLNENELMDPNLNRQEYQDMKSPAKISTTVENSPKVPSESPSTPSPATVTSQSNESWSNHSSYSQETQESPFRIPKGRPPSRTQTSTVSPDTIQHNTSTFLKPYPPNAPKTDYPPAPPPTWNGPHGVHGAQQEDVKPNYDYHPATPYTGTYPTPQSGYSNYHPGFGPAPYTPAPHHPYNPYENNHLNYPNLDYANIKREEYFRNTAAAAAACYNPYGGYHHPQNYPPPPNWNHHPTPNWCPNPAPPPAPPTAAPPSGGPPNPWFTYPPFGIPPYVPEQPKSEPIGEVTDFTDNEECFKDSQMGGVAIALGKFFNF